MQDFRNLAVWKKSHELTLAVYGASAMFPQHEAYGLRSSIRRTAMTIPCRIADGAGCQYDHEFVRFLHSANQAGSELEYLCLLSKDLGYFDQATHEKLSTAVVEVRRMLMGLIKSIGS
jgi:four helix bundle protein